MAEEDVVTRFKAEGADAYTRAMGSIGDIAQSAGNRLTALISTVNPLNVALGALAGVAGGVTLSSLGQLGSQFENVQSRMAGTLSALEFTPNFTEGLKAAEAVMDRINTAAAALPGEAEDYVEVFVQTLPIVNRAVGGSLEQMTAFTNRYTAVARSLQVDAMQAGRDLTMMLREGVGGAGADVRTFMTLLPLMKQVEGFAGLTRDSFNKMSETARAGLLEQASGSWDAIVGSVKTTGRLITRLGSQPLFENMKTAMSQVNSLFVDVNGQLTPFGNTVVRIGNEISVRIGGGLLRAADGVSFIAKNFDSLLTTVQNLPVVKFIDSLLTGVRDLANTQTVGGGAIGMLLAGPIGALVGAVLGLDFVLETASQLASAFWGIIDAVWPTIEAIGANLQPVIGELVNLFVALAPSVANIASLLGELIVQLLPIIGGFVAATVALVEFFTPAIKATVDTLKPVMEYLAIIAGVVAVAFTAIAIATSPVTLAVLALGIAIAGLIKFIRWLTSADVKEGIAKIEADRKKAETPQLPAGIAGLLEKFKTANQGTTRAPTSIAGLTAPQGPRTPAARGGAKVVQDFRNSRFTIQQDFKEGFDPDRIAVAFARDVGRMGEQRLQSGLEPLFAVRG